MEIFDACLLNWIALDFVICWYLGVCILGYSDSQLFSCFPRKVGDSGNRSYVNFNILYDYDKLDEINKFLSNFTEYFPYYVSNADLLEYADFKGGMKNKLLELSKKCWINPNVPKRDYKKNGIFGELFLDFYERIVKGSKLISTYASRRDFNSNGESKGFDNVFFRISGDNIEPI